MKNKKIIGICAIILIILIIGINIVRSQSKEELISIKSEKQLMSIYKKNDAGNSNIALFLAGMPFNLLGISDGVLSKVNTAQISDISEDGVSYDVATSDSSTNKSESTSEKNDKEYSTTNIQVKNVDEADITKTDGNYIYSISENNVVITNVKEPENMKIEAKISNEDGYFPEDMILYKNKLAVISSQYNSYYEQNTMVTIFDISDKKNPNIEEQYTLYSKYYTSRCIEGRLFVICSEELRKEDDKIVTYYTENNLDKEMGLDNIKYIKENKNANQTLISTVNLNDIKDVKVKAYLFNTENAYVSENNIYILNDEYTNEKKKFWSYMKTLALKGIVGLIREYENDDWNFEQYTTIYKFKINDDGSLEYKNKTKLKGETINQFSADEYKNNLRVALESDEGSRIVVLDENLKTIGETDYLSKGEKMYSTRFLGNKAYMVTYKNTDPLYVIDLSDPKNPKDLGNLKIPGYSTYLHPYDENHLIGIGMQTEEKVYRNSKGKIISTWAVTTGMKMALFDVSDVNNPIQISQTLIGDEMTTSAILTNHKALLFSKEKQLIAIPVNRYSSNFEVETYDFDDVSTIQSMYKRYEDKRVAEGYWVYNLNLEDGFKLKGTIEHASTSNKNNKYNYYGYESKLLRGLWIENDLYTVSEDMIKVNNLDDLSLISELKIK